MQHQPLLLFESEICTRDLAIPIPGASSYSTNQPNIITTLYSKIAYGCDKGTREINMDIIVINPATGTVAIIDGMGGYGEESSKALLPITSYIQQAVRGDLEITLAHQRAEQELDTQEIRGGAVYLLLSFDKKTYLCASAGDAGMVHFNSNNEILFSSLAQTFNGSPFNFIRGSKFSSSREPRLPVYNLGIGPGKTINPNPPKNTWDPSPRLYDIGDRFILASDGLWGALNYKESTDLIKDVPLEQTIQLLGKEAKKRMDSGNANKDNLSIVVCEMTNEPK